MRKMKFGFAAMLALITLATFCTPSFAQRPPVPNQKAYIRDDIATSASAIEDRLKREVAVPGSANAAALLRQAEQFLSKDEARKALPLANQAAIAEPRNAKAWRVMASAAKAIEPRDYRERYDLQERAVAAAYLGYQRAANRQEEASALALLGGIFEWREQWRPALTVYRLSLDAADVPETRAAYEALREKRGFRLSDNKVDADSASPRACFTFSEALARGRVDFAPFVAVSGKGDFAVSAEGNEICVDGLLHGERYAIVLRQGIPSAIEGENLLKSADYEIYVRDRTPSVRFTGKNYVLPRTGQQGVPLVSVNTAKVALDVFRIGDRNLINTIHSGEFLEQLANTQTGRIADESGQKIWSGSMEIKSELNKDVITAFPALEALGSLKPGIYLLSARPEDGKPRPPAEDGDGEIETGATQWFVVSDMGLTAFSGGDGVHVLARSLADAGPVAGAEITLLARNNEILGTAKTDAKGYARFDAGLARGQGGLSPGLVTIKLGEDFGFLDLKQTAFDLTDRGVGGRITPLGLDAYLYAERGVYRPAETVFLTALLRDAKGAGVAGMPLTVVVRRPDGVEYKRLNVTDQGGGGRALSLPLVANAPPGTWRILAYSDPKRDPIGETSFLVEDYVPERLEIEVKAKREMLKSGEPAEIDVTARYLYGAPGADLTVSASALIRTTTQSAIPGFAGYRVGLADEEVEAQRSEIEEKPTTDEKGVAALGITLSEPATNLPLEAEITVSVAESGGRAVSRSLTLPILPKGYALGIKPLFEGGELAEGATASFAAILASGDGKRIARSGVKWQLSRINRNYQWYFKDGRWAYEAAKTTRRVADGEVNLGEGEAAKISAKVSWGNYRIEMRADGLDGAQTAFDFSVGYVAEAKADTPDVLELTLDKAAYADGDTMQVRLAPHFAGKATLAVMSDKLELLESVDVAAGGSTIPLKVSKNWGAGAYLVALAHRPMDQAAQRMPGRAIGVSWFTIDKAARTLALDLGAPNLIRPRTTLDLPIRITGLAPGEKAYVTLAAVDIGILNLTKYASPNPTEHYFGQKRLSADIRDLYGMLIDGMQGTRGQVRTGGDAASINAAEKPTQEPLARYSGIVEVGPDGTAKVSFDIPTFNGSVRVMGVAWTQNRTGQASADVIIRDPIVVQATLPRFLAIGDQTRFHLEINNVEGAAGDYLVDLDVRGPVSMAASATQHRLKLAKGQKTVLTLPVTAAGIGRAAFDVRLTGGGHDLSQTLALRVQPSSSVLANRTVRPIAGGASLTISNDLLAEFIPDSGSVSITVSPFAALDVPALLKALDRYPYGCTEQTISRAMPLLYLNQLASLEQLALDDSAETRITAAVERILARQGANGSFGLWSVGGDDLWLDAFVTDFLTRAREKNIAVPQIAFTLALDRLRNKVVNTSEIRKEEAADIAYAIYVLARNGRPVMGDLRYLADNKLEDFSSPLAQGHLAAALALLGDRTRSKTAFASALKSLGEAKDDGFSRPDFGSKLRDGAALLALLAESNADRADIVKVAGQVETARNASRYTSTQEQGWMVLAAQALAKEAENFTLQVDGTVHKGALYRTYRQAALDAKPVVITNPGSSNARAIVTVAGVPVAPEPALDQGYRVTRTLRDMKGGVVDPAKLKQNERYVVVLEVSENKASYAQLLLVDPLPAGLEIENPNLTEGASIEGLDFIKDTLTPSHFEARDDRFVAAFDRNGGTSSKPSFSIAYIARAVTPGRYVHPGVSVEDMYRPDRFGRGTFGTLTIEPAK